MTGITEFPQTLPPNTVVGRLANTPGIATAATMPQLASALLEVGGISSSSFVSFLQSGIGAVATDLQTRGRLIIYLADFLPGGYVTDGSVDYTTQFQRALTAAAGKVLNIPTGTWNLSAALTMTGDNTILVGQGRGTILAPSSTTADIFLIGDGTNEISGLQFLNFRIWPSVTKTAGYAFNCRYLTDAIFRDVYVGTNDDYVANGNAHRLYDGYYFNYFSHIKINGGDIVVSHSPVQACGKVDQSWGAELFLDGEMRILNSSQPGILLGGGTGGVYVGRVDISGCGGGVWWNKTLTAVYNREAFVSNLCTIDSCTHHAISVDDDSLETLDLKGWISACGSAAGGYSGIWVNTTTGVACTINAPGLRVQDCPYDGVEVSSGVLNWVGGLCRSNGSGVNGGHGILYSGGRATIKGVLVHSNGSASRGDGLQIGPSADGFVIEGNQFFSNAANQLVNNSGVSNTKIIRANLGYSAEWVAYTPTITAGSGTLTSVSATGYWFKEDRTVHFQIVITITTNGTGATRIDATLPPFTAAGVAVVAGQETAVTGKLLCGLISDTSTVVKITNYDNTYPAANGYLIEVSGSYRANS